MTDLRHFAGASALALFSSTFASPALLANELNPDIGVTLDGYYRSGEQALSHREEGFGLGHTELTLSSPIDDRFEGRLTAVLEDHAGDTELGLEEAYIQTTGLPWHLNLRAGRFLSQVGYLNGQHLHADDFVERPAAYRALLGSHYFDDGVRVNLLLPTPFYWRVGAEALAGDRLGDTDGDEDIGVYTLSTKLGGDLSASQSWQAGFAWLRNRLTDVASDGDAEHDHDHDHGHDHAGHSHGASYTGKNLYITDLVWKWAPQGNTRQSQLTLSGEYLYADDLNRYASSDDTQEGWYASAVYQFAPQWSTGVRYGEVDLKEAHGDHFHDQSLEETEVMLAWSHSHFSTLRLQYTHQSTDGFEADDNTVTVQYVMSFGAHGAHDY
ncbi:MAG: hypothetical protein MI794_14420 [Pseudomonadales bacterium]|nr:hypothetical protein [Pseudomonadales bacterium]